MEEFGEFGLEIKPLPETTDQIPLPTSAVLADNAPVVTLHKFKSNPALDVVGDLSTCTCILSMDAGQTPFVTTHVNLLIAPIVNPIAVELGEVGTIIDPLPETTNQFPLPIIGELAERTVDVLLHIVWSNPAKATVGIISTRITMRSEVMHDPLVIVHLRVAEAPGTRPVREEVSEAGVVMVAAPATKVQSPVPTPGALPARVAEVVLQRV